MAASPLFAIWINLHGCWMIGFASWDLLPFRTYERVMGKHLYGAMEPEQLKKLTRVGVASVVALFANPYGWKLVAYPLDLASRQKLNVRVGEEWPSLDFHTSNGKAVLLAHRLSGSNALEEA